MEAKNLAIISYLTLLGWILALVLNNPKQELVSLHIRQYLGIILVGLASGLVMIIPLVGWIVGFVGYILALVFWVMGLISAIKGEMKPVPIIGVKAQEWFKSL